MQPIPKTGPDARFVLSGTEVFHKRCVALISNSLRVRMHADLMVLRIQVQNAVPDRQETQRLRMQVEDLERQLKQRVDEYNRRHGEMTAQKQRADVLQRQLQTAADDMRGLASQGEYRDRRTAEIERELAEARREIERLRAVQTIDKAVSDTGLDDAAQRFAMLELDIDK